MGKKIESFGYLKINRYEKKQVMIIKGLVTLPTTLQENPSCFGREDPYFLIDLHTILQSEVSYFIM